MAEAPDAMEHMLSCPVCFNDYGEGNNEFTPRLLPCSHTVCEACTKQLIQDQKMECPECRTKHEAKNEEKSFPQNKYILTQLMTKEGARKQLHAQRSCKEHKKELILFCKEPDCQKAICTACLKTSHRKHDVTEIEDEKKEIIMKSIQLFRANLQKKIRKISSAKETIETEADVCIKALMTEKEEICQTFEKTIEESRKKAEEMRTLVKDELSAMNETMTVLNDVEKAMENLNLAENTYEDIMGKMDTINGIEENINAYLSGTREYVYNHYISRQEIRRMVEEKRVRVELTEHSDKDDDSQHTHNDDGDGDESEYADCHDIDDTTLNCGVSQTKEVQLDVSFLAVLSDGNLGLCGRKDNQWKLKHYNLLTGGILNCVCLSSEVRGMSSLKLGETAALAISYEDNSSIEFRAENLDQVLSTVPVWPYKPGRLCTMLPSTLLFADDSRLPSCHIHWMDCSPKKPKVLNNVIATEYKDIWEIQYAQKERLLIVVAMPGNQGFHAYNVDNRTLKWSVVEKLPGMKKNTWPCGITNDERGRLFMCDSRTGNNCIQMFRVADGRYLGCLIKEGDEGLRDVSRVLWCETAKSLVVVHRKGNGRSSISTIKFN